MFGLTRYRIVKSGLLAVLAIILLVAVIAHKMIGDNVGSPVIDVLTLISVTDGDTVRSGGYAYRLVGFDAPESGLLARCERERTLAAAATRRLKQLISNGATSLQRVACSCRPGTEETQACNYGRRCGVLKPCGSPAVSGKRRCRRHGGAPGSGASRGNKNALKHGRYTREAFEERRQLQALLRQSRMLIQKIE